MKPVRILGQPSWRIESDRVEAFVTRAGGHLGPVTFQLPRRKVQPFPVAPWAEERLPPDTPQLLKSLRGDFFCLPFGANTRSCSGEAHPPHGETANAVWTLERRRENARGAHLRLKLDPAVRKGHVTKEISLVPGHTALYCRHTVSGMRGRMCFGHHAMLEFPPESGSGRISTSRMHFGQVCPGGFESPAEGGYTSLKPGARFKNLARVPLRDGGTADLTRYPARPGFEDLVMCSHRAADDFAWSAVAFPKQRHAWFALKDPRILASTILWISNGGRHYPPWNGRHRRVLGVEDATAHFADGLAESARPNPVSQMGIPTSLRLREKSPLVVSYIMAVTPIPAGFDVVQSIRRTKDGVTLTSRSGKRALCPLDHAFLGTS